jgi:hypothetical protein
VQDQLVELRAADLRFTLDEAAAFLNQAMQLGLAPDAEPARSRAGDLETAVRRFAICGPGT